MLRKSKKINYVIATLGILGSILLGNLDESWSIPRMIIFAVCLLITIISAAFIVKNELDD